MPCRRCMIFASPTRNRNHKLRVAREVEGPSTTSKLESGRPCDVAFPRYYSHWWQETGVALDVLPKRVGAPNIVPSANSASADVGVPIWMQDRSLLPVCRRTGRPAACGGSGRFGGPGQSGIRIVTPRNVSPRALRWRRIKVWQTSLVRGKHSHGHSRH
jgi:hypothetical protein